MMGTVWDSSCPWQDLGTSMQWAGSWQDGNSWDTAPQGPGMPAAPRGAQQRRYLPHALCRALSRAAGASARPWARTCSSSAPGVAACAGRARSHPGSTRALCTATRRQKSLRFVSETSRMCPLGGQTPPSLGTSVWKPSDILIWFYLSSSADNVLHFSHGEQSRKHIGYFMMKVPYFVSFQIRKIPMDMSPSCATM